MAFDRVVMNQASCGLCGRWWAWPQTEGMRRNIPTCPGCRGYTATSCCNICGSMVTPDYTYTEFVDGRDANLCPVCYCNARRVDWEIVDRDEFLAPYCDFLVAQAQAEVRARPPAGPRCNCNTCGGRAPRATR